MRYNISAKTEMSCTITLLPETTVEETLLKTSKDEDTFMFHYIKALETHISPDATFIKLLEYDRFPSPVTVAYQLSKVLVSEYKHFLRNEY